MSFLVHRVIYPYLAGGESMDIVKRVDALYEALDNSSLTDKAELNVE